MACAADIPGAASQQMTTNNNRRVVLTLTAHLPAVSCLSGRENSSERTRRESSRPLGRGSYMGVTRRPLSLLRRHGVAPVLPPISPKLAWTPLRAKADGAPGPFTPPDFVWAALRARHP